MNLNTNSNKNIEKFSLLNSLKGKDSKKISKLIINNNLNDSKNSNHNPKNNNISLLKEIQNDCNNFRKSKTTDKIAGNKVNLLIGYQENQANNNNQKIMIKQNNIKKFNKLNLNIAKIPKYDYSSFNQVMKYYTLKSESKTIQIDELSSYFRPIRNLLGIANANKIKTHNNNSSIHIHKHLKSYENNIIDKANVKDEKIINNQNLDNLNINAYNTKEEIINYNSIEYDDEKIQNIQSTTNLINNNLFNDSHTNDADNINDNSKININTSLIKNCVFNNKNISYNQKNNKLSQIPFCIKIDKIDNTNSKSNLNDNNNKTSSNNIENINTNSNTNNIINSKNISENEMQISSNFNINNGNQDTKSTQSQTSSQTLYQFRPRKIHLPKNGINLSTMQFKNQILQNILNKRKQNK